MLFLFFFNDTATTEIYTLSLHDALPISARRYRRRRGAPGSRTDHGDAGSRTCPPRESFMTRPKTAAPRKGTRKPPAEPVEAIAPLPAPARPEPSVRELAAGQEARERGRTRHKRVQAAANPEGPGLARSPHSDDSLFTDVVLDSLGTTSTAFAERVIAQLAIAMSREGADPVASL